MKLVKLYQVPQRAQVVLQDLGQLGVRISPNNLDTQQFVLIELEGTPGGSAKRLTTASGSQHVFVDDAVVLLSE